MKSLSTSVVIPTTAEFAWMAYTSPQHITQWNFASPEWSCPRAENDLREGGLFNYRMEAKDGSFGFDLTGHFALVDEPRQLIWILGDGRRVRTIFTPMDGNTMVQTDFEPEQQNSHELQQSGWQAILDNYAAYVKSCLTLERMQYQIDIDAGAERIWSCMLDRPGYNEWTSVFAPGSDYEGVWEKDADIIFGKAAAGGIQDGILSRIEQLEPLRKVVIEHRGMLQNGQRITEGPAVVGWQGAKEIYVFEPQPDGQTRVIVSIDVNASYKAYFEDTWPKALDRLKTIAEAE